MAKKIMRLKRGGNDMMVKKPLKLDVKKIQAKRTTIVSSEESLKDISPMSWSNDVLSGKKKVIMVLDK